MKKFLSFFLSICLVITLSPASFATGDTSTDNGYNDPVVYNDFGFSAVLTGDGKVAMNWTAYAPSGFNYYKVVRSKTNPNPVYPEDGYIKVSSDPDFSSYTDTSPPAGTLYYRVCSIAKPDRYCSQVVVISSEGSTTTEEPEKDTANEDTVVDKSVDFYDIKDHEYSESINYLIDNEVVKGYEENEVRVYKPEQSINRVEFLKILIETKFGSSSYTSFRYQVECFTDIEIFANQEIPWYVGYACLAKDYKIISGYPDGSLQPDKPINFAEAAKIIVNVYNLQISPTTGAWHAPYVKALQDKNYIPPSIDTEDDHVNRGEMAELIWRVENEVEDKETKNLISAPINTSSADYDGWQVFSGDGYSFHYPSNWYSGEKRGWDYLSEEKDYIDNLLTPNYMAVDTYLVTYSTQASESVPDEEALRTYVYFDHPEIAAENLTINDTPALRRKFRAPRGTVVNGRTTGENEIIILYTYRNGLNVHIVQFFNAMGREDYGIAQFDEIAGSFRVE